MESGFCIRNTYHRSIFRSEVLALRTSCPADLNSRPNLLRRAKGGADSKPRRVRAVIYRTLSQRQSPPYSTSRSLDNCSAGWAPSRAAAEFPKKTSRRAAPALKRVALSRCATCSAASTADSRLCWPRLLGLFQICSSSG